MRKFKTGEKVYCVIGNDKSPVHPLLKTGNWYIIHNCFTDNTMIVNGIDKIVNVSRFINVSEIRRQKILSIYE